MRNRPALRRAAMLCTAVVLSFPISLAAQSAPESWTEKAWVPPAPGAPEVGAAPAPVFTSQDPARGPKVIHWYQGLLFMGAMAALTPLDEPIRDEVQASRNSGRDDVARALRHFGQPEVYATVALGTVATGLISGNSRITRAGARISSGIALGGLMSSLLKLSVGRRRPFSSEEQYTFGPFSKVDASWPSGHTMTAFALATGVSDELHSTPVTIGMYTLATGVAWSRMNDNKHWLSDVVAGAAIGITSTKLMNGRWRVFGIGAPRVLLEPGHAGLEWRARF